jgi:hypothetical protein
MWAARVEDLRPEDGAVIADAEDAKDDGEKCWVAGEADECGVQAGAVAQSVDTVGQPIRREVAVNQAIAGDDGKAMHQDDSQQQAEDECQGDGHPVAARSWHCGA